MNDNYSLLSRTNVHVAKFKDMFITLPYYKGYHYVAYMSPNGNMVGQKLNVLNNTYFIG